MIDSHVGDHIHVALTLEHAWAAPGLTVIGGVLKSKEWYWFPRVHRRSNCSI